MRDRARPHVSIPHHRRIAIAACALAACTTASAAGAQVAGTVRASGAPLPRVIVSLWNGSRELARDTTDTEGRFAFDSVKSIGASGLVLRRLGYVARTLSVRPGDVGLGPTMVQVAQSLPATVVAATRGRRCVRKDDRAARALWDSVRATYAVAPHGMAASATLDEWTRRDVSADEVGETSGRPRGEGSWGVSRTAMSGWWTSLAREGYAWRRPLPKAGEELIEPQYLHWTYAPLHRELVEHFVEDGFARMHAFTMTTSSSGARTVAFCPRDAKRPGLEGTADIDDAGALQRIAWRWRTPKPDEDAGAELLLVPPGRAGVRRLVPARTIYWRRLGGKRDRYFQDVMTTRGWYYSAHDGDPTENERVRP